MNVYYLFIKENAKTGTHIWSDIPKSMQNNESCYLADQEALV